MFKYQQNPLAEIASQLKSCSQGLSFDSHTSKGNLLQWHIHLLFGLPWENSWGTPQLQCLDHESQFPRSLNHNSLHSGNRNKSYIYDFLVGPNLNLEPDMEVGAMSYCYSLQAPRSVMKRSKPVLELRLLQVLPFKKISKFIQPSL